MPSPAGEIVVLRIAGDVDLASRHLVEAALGALLDHRPSHLLVDLSGLLFCDVTGLTLLVDAAATATAHGIGYSVSAPPRQANRVWTLLWAADELPPRHPTTGAGPLAAMATQNERRHRIRPRPPRVNRTGLRVVADPDHTATDTDRQLIDSARSGDVDAYRTLVLRHRTRMFRSALHTLTASDDPDDTAQDLAACLHSALAAFAEASPR